MKKQYSFWKTYARFICLLLLAATCKPAYSQQDQDNASVYLLKKDWSAAKNMKEATYFMQFIHDNDSTYICRYYNKFSSMIRQESYLDSGLIIPNGRFCWYDQYGMLDSTGLVSRRKKTGEWKYYDDNGELAVVIVYNNGHRIEKRDYLKKEFTDESGNNIPYSINKNAVPDIGIADSFTGEVLFKNVSIGEPDSIEQWKDYLKQHITIPERVISIYKNSWCRVVVSFTINKEGKTEGIYLAHSCEWSADNEVLNAVKMGPPLRFVKKNEDNTEYSLQQEVSFYPLLNTDRDPVQKFEVSIGVLAPERFSGVRERATFPGGPDAWARFLQRNLNSGVPLNYGAPVGIYIVVVSFLVQKDGTIGEVRAEMDPGYGTAEEVIRIFKKGPKWIPATENGKPVIYRQKQAITFHVGQN